MKLSPFAALALVAAVLIGCDKKAPEPAEPPTPPSAEAPPVAPEAAPAVEPAPTSPQAMQDAATNSQEAPKDDSPSAESE